MRPHVLAVLFLLPMLAASQDAGPTSLAEVDRAMANLRAMIERVPTAMKADLDEEAGGLLEKDIAATVLTADAAAKIAAARAEAETALATNPDDKAALQRAGALVVREIARISLHANYRSLQFLQRRHMQYIAPLLDQASESERALAQARLGISDATVEAIRTGASAEDPVGWRRSFNGADPTVQVRSTYNEVRGTLAAHVWKLREASGQWVPFQLRSTACALPIAPPGPSSRLAVRSAPDLTRYYPLVLQSLAVEGVVRVEIRVSATGCVMQARVAVSSGVQLLDEAAVAASFEMAMSPASENGVAVPAASLLPLRFKLPPAQMRPTVQ